MIFSSSKYIIFRYTSGFYLIVTKEIVHSLLDHPVLELNDERKRKHKL